MQAAAQPDAAKSESAAPIFDVISESDKATNLAVLHARATKLDACLHAKVVRAMCAISTLSPHSFYDLIRERCWGELSVSVCWGG